MKKKYKLIFLIFFSLIIILLFFSVFFSLININNNNILEGISINGIDISNMSKDEAFLKLSNIINTKKNNNIIIQTSSRYNNPRNI